MFWRIFHINYLVFLLAHLRCFSSSYSSAPCFIIFYLVFFFAPCFWVMHFHDFVIFLPPQMILISLLPIYTEQILHLSLLFIFYFLFIFPFHFVLLFFYVSCASLFSFISVLFLFSFFISILFLLYGYFFYFLFLPLIFFFHLEP